MTAKRRFIAGAVCPRCSAMDTVVVFQEQGADFRECVQCGFKDQMRFKPVARELTTRVNASPLAETQVVTIIAPPADSEGSR